jgi:hypothetical protein
LCYFHRLTIPDKARLALLVLGKAFLIVGENCISALDVLEGSEDGLGPLGGAAITVVPLKIWSREA